MWGKKLAERRQRKTTLPGTSLSAVQYSTVRDTTDRVGLVPLRLFLEGGQQGGEEIGWARLFPSASLSFLLPPRYEYQFGVYLKDVIISKSNKQSVCVGTAHYFPDRCMRDGYGVELQQEMCHLSAAVTERSI